jgi:hypothetical protein
MARLPWERQFEQLRSSIQEAQQSAKLISRIDPLESANPQTGPTRSFWEEKGKTRRA